MTEINPYSIQLVNKAIGLAKSVYRAIIRQGSSIIDKQDIKTMNRFRVAVITQGPDLHLFSHPGILSRLALWLVEALRDKGGATTMGRSKKKCLPFIVASLDEQMGTYNVVGVTAALEFGDVRKKLGFPKLSLDLRLKRLPVANSAWHS